MIKLKELSKLNVKKLNAKEMFDEFLEFKDNWAKVLTGKDDIKLEKFEVHSYTTLDMLKGINSRQIIDLEINDKITLLKIFLIYKIFSKQFEDKNYTIDENRFILLIRKSDLYHKLFKFGLLNLISLVDFLSIYAKSFLNSLGEHDNINFDLYLEADGENPLSLIRLGLLSYTEMNYRELSLEAHKFYEHTKPTDVYAFEMFYFALFENFTKTCDIDDPILEIKNPAPIYNLLYNKNKYSIVYKDNSSMNYNLVIEVDKKSTILEDLINEEC